MDNSKILDITALKNQKIFINYKLEKNNKGVLTKPPVNPNDCTKLLNISDTTKYVNYETAVANHTQELCDGVGIVLTCNEKYALCGIDVDAHINDANNHIEELKQQFEGTYMEISPSGNGLHILFFVKKISIPTNYNENYLQKNSKEELECYVGGISTRYFTFTENTHGLAECPVVDMTEQFLLFINKYMTRTKALAGDKLEKDTKCSMNQKELEEFVEQRISKARTSKKTGKDFCKLYDAQDISKFKSESEARQRLCGYLAFWLDKSKDAMLIVYKKSALYREDKAHDTKCIDNAIRTCTSIYGEKTEKKHTRVDDYFEKIKKLNLDFNEKYNKFDDISCSNLVATLIKNQAVFVTEQKEWYVYNGVYWEEDLCGLHTSNLVKCIALAIYKYYETIIIPKIRNNKEYDDKYKEILCRKKVKICEKWTGMKYRENVLKDTQSLLTVKITKFDSNKLIFNAANKTIILNLDGSFEFKDHDPNDYCSKHSNVVFNPNIKNERWNQFLSQITSGNVEKEKFIRKIFGYSLSGLTENECCFLFLGKTTRNGKSTLLDTVVQMYGDYGTTGNAETVMETRRNYSSNGPSEDLARLAGIRFLNVPEPENGFVLNVARVKKMTGNDPINARFLNENSFVFNPMFKIVIASNHQPTVNDDTLFSSERIYVIPFERKFSEAEQDKTLKQLFQSQEVQSAVLNWALQGWKELREEGLTIPECVKEATHNFKEEQDRLIQFMDECLVPKVGLEVKSKDVYEAYSLWCRQNNYMPLGKSKWIDAMRAKGAIFQKKRPSNGALNGHGATNMLLGYELAPDYLPQR